MGVASVEFIDPREPAAIVPILRAGLALAEHASSTDMEESQLAEITRDSAKITVEQVHGLMSQVIKAILFNSVHQLNRPHTELSGPKLMMVQCGDVEFEKKIDEKIGQFIDRVEKHPSKKIDEKIG
ncbi:COP9 signalosome complex subunit 5 [Camellia lanceoleosa]|uniref:COP9 signalosome complex subunit 5 n=1 Tax=Camellia lanceoleosa TaxID=1840588 RepID=A0ACC0H5C3_9ERIC|nr:COP9 signalosome complex subunit 5 [Camellia lanceoleosa]